MALSNIFREPRREITESVLGIAPLAVWLYVDYHLSVAIEAAVGPGNLPWQAAMFLLTLGLGASLFFLTLLALATHALGETICNALARRGLELRPKNRPNQRR